LPTLPNASSQRVAKHRVSVANPHDVSQGEVRWSPLKSLWSLSMALAALIGGVSTFNWSALTLFVCSTLFVLLFGHSLGSHRKLIHNSFQCPRWLEYFLVYCGLQVGLAGPLGLLQQHELRDFAQRLPHCHDYLRHGRGLWCDAWWQLNCELHLTHEPRIEIESRIAHDTVFRFFERTWMLQHALVAALFYLWGDWAFVFWGVCARVTAGVFGHWLIGYFAHNHGPMSYEIRGAAVQGHNIRWASLITMGECWHNNHHAFPGSARLGLARGEWDPGWWVLMAFERLGLAWDFRLPKDLPLRDELAPVLIKSAIAAKTTEALIRTPKEIHE
jgi:fatty-acid desaturase